MGTQSVNVTRSRRMRGLSKRLVAHRGSPFEYPENTLPGIEAAVETGTRWFEVDVQFTSDFIPVVYHDDTLLRVSGANESILDTPLSRLRQHSAAYSEKFGDRFADVPIITLERLWHQLKKWDDVQIFLEVKTHAIEHFGREPVMKSLLKSIEEHGLEDSIGAIISKDDGAMVYARERTGLPIGFVLPEYSEKYRIRCQRAMPDFIFIKSTRLPTDPAKIWSGNWKWVVYTINDVDEAQSWFERGIDMVETDRIGDMMDHFRNWDQQQS
ncbi:MAG: glycerophosphodiester phosphodiesterase family protein [Planctomycetota bacterium]